MIMLRNGNLGLKMGVSRAAHTQYANIWKYPPPPVLISNHNHPSSFYMNVWCWWIGLMVPEMSGTWKASGKSGLSSPRYAEARGEINWVFRWNKEEVCLMMWSFTREPSFIQRMVYYLNEVKSCWKNWALKKRLQISWKLCCLPCLVKTRKAYILATPSDICVVLLTKLNNNIENQL